MINDESQGKYNKDNQIRFKTSMLRSSLCDYSDAYILFKETITAENKAAQGQPNNGTNRKVIFKNCAPFFNHRSRINNMQVDDAHDIDVVMSMCSLIEYSDNYSKTSGILWQYCRDELTLSNVVQLLLLMKLMLLLIRLKLKEKIGKTVDNGRQNVQIMAPLKYLCNFWRTREMSVINCDLNWSKNCIIAVTDVAEQVITFAITDTKFYLPVVTLSNQDNVKLLAQLKSGFKRAIN